MTILDMPQKTEDSVSSAAKTQAIFFLPQKFCGNVAGIPRKKMGVQGCLLFVISAMILVALQKQ